MQRGMKHMVNMPFEITPEDVVSAMKVADKLGSSL